MVKDIQHDLKPIMAEHSGLTALFLSGGSDSLLLLHILLDMGARFHCITFDYSFSQEQKARIDALTRTFGLRVLSYQPSEAYLIGDGKDRVSMVEEYLMSNNITIPFVRDCVHNDNVCIHDEKFGTLRQDKAPVGFTLYLTGARKSDRHYTVGRALKSQTRTKDGITVHAPLWDLTRRDVKKLLAIFKERVPKLDTGVLDLCTKCLTATAPVLCPRLNEQIEPHNWDPATGLKIFRGRFGFDS